VFDILDVRVKVIGANKEPACSVAHPQQKLSIRSGERLPNLLFQMNYFGISAWLYLAWLCNLQLLK